MLENSGEPIAEFWFSCRIQQAVYDFAASIEAFRDFDLDKMPKVVKEAYCDLWELPYDCSGELFFEAPSVGYDWRSCKVSIQYLGANVIAKFEDLENAPVDGLETLINLVLRVNNVPAEETFTWSYVSRERSTLKVAVVCNSSSYDKPGYFGLLSQEWLLQHKTVWPYLMHLVNRGVITEENMVKIEKLVNE